MTVVKQVWWKRIGFWLGLWFTYFSAWDLVVSAYGVRALVSVGVLPVGLFFLVHGWRQGVEVHPEGFRSRRITRGKRGAAWDEVERFAAPAGKGAAAILKDGSTITLFDWPGDSPRVTALLEQQRARLREAPRH